MIVVYLFIVCLFIYFNIKNPTYYFIFYILMTSKFLGFMDFSSLQLAGMDIGFFGINLLTSLTSLTSLSSLFKIKQKKSQLKLKGFILLIIFLIIYGIVKPILSDTSNFIQALMASKDYWSYSILLYIVVNKNRIEVIKIIKFVKIIGIYLASMYIIGLIIPAIVPPKYYIESYVRVAYTSYIVAAIYLFVAEYKIKRFNYLIVFKILFCFVGIIISGRFSLTFSMLLGVLLLIYGFDKTLNLLKFNVLKLFGLSLILVVLTSLMNPELVNTTYDSIISIIDGTDAALSSRATYNEFRIKAINENMWFGYGFVHHSTEIMSSFDTFGSNRFMKSFGVIDSGYIDFLIKFGWVGLIAYLFLFFKYLYSSFKTINKSVYTISMSVFLATYVLINYTWSVFTYPMGISSMAIAVLIISKGVELNKK